MIPLRFAGCNVVLTAEGDALPAFQDDGEVWTEVWTAWEPSQLELEQLAAGMPIWLCLAMRPGEPLPSLFLGTSGPKASAVPRVDLQREGRALNAYLVDGQVRIFLGTFEGQGDKELKAWHRRLQGQLADYFAGKVDN